MWLQEIIAQRETKSEKEDLPLWQSMEEKVFSGILFCGDCMGRMKRRSQRKMVDGKRYRIYGYVCAQNERMNKICSYRVDMGERLMRNCCSKLEDKAASNGWIWISKYKIS